MADVSTPSNAVMAVAASALKAQQARMRIIAENMANADSVASTPGGDPYRRQVPVFGPIQMDGGLEGVAMKSVAADPSNFRKEYQPGHPAADTKGYVQLPNVDPLIEAMDMRDAQRAYEANLNVIDAAKEMQSSTLELLKR